MARVWVGAIGCFLVAAILWLALQPAQPRLGAPATLAIQQSGYRPGGPECDPGRQASRTAIERQLCSEAAEQHRLQAADLVQQTRSADAAEALTELSFAQSRLMVAGAIVGLFTLIAAFSAAWYAKRAAEAAESTLAHGREVSAMELRPYLYFGEAKLTEPLGRKSKLSVPIRNHGQTPGLGIRLGLTSEVVPRPIGDHSILVQISEWEQIGMMGPGALDSASITLGEFSEAAFDAISAGDTAILLFLRMEYEDRFGNPDSTEVTLFIDKESLEGGDVEVLTDWSRHNRCNPD